MKSSFKIPLICSIGAILGTLLGFQFITYIGLIISIVSGAITGYVLLNPKVVIIVIRVACRIATQIKIIGRSKSNISRNLTRSNVIYIIYTLVTLFILWSASSSIFIFIAWLSQLKDLVLYKIIMYISLVPAFMFVLKINNENKMKTKELQMFWIWKFLNPICLPFTLLLSTIKIIIFIDLLIICYVKKFFIFINSKPNFIFAIYAAVGGISGCIYKSILVAGIVAMLFSILHTQISSVKS